MQAGSTYAALVGAVIAQLRDELAVSQADLAKSVGIGQPAWSRIEKGESALTIDQLARAGHRLGKEPSEILHLADNTTHEMRDQNLEVSLEKPQRKSSSGSNSDLLLLGGAALIALICAANKSK